MSEVVYDDGDDLGRDIEAAFEEVEDASEDEEAEDAEEPSGSEREGTDGESDGEEGEEGGEEDEDEEDAEGDEEGAGEEGEDDEGEEDSEDEGEEDDVGPPPSSWRALGREAWKDVPPAARAEIERREQEIRDTLQQTTNQRRFFEHFHQIAHPFREAIQREGTSPLGAFQGLLTTANTLQTGTTREKAATVAQIVAQYDVDIEALDEALSQPQTDRAAIDAAIKPYRDRLAQYEGQGVAPQQGQAPDPQATYSELQKFAEDPVNEFYQDVRLDMADIIEAAGRRGEHLTLKEAYDRAVETNRDVQSILKSRNSEEDAKARKRKAAAKRRAAKSIRNRSGNSGGGKRREAPKNDYDDIGNDIDEAIRLLEEADR